MKVNKDSTAQIITAGPTNDGNLRAEATDFDKSMHHPVNMSSNEEHRIERLDVPDDQIDSVWQKMTGKAEDINKAGLNYNYLA